MSFEQLLSTHIGRTIEVFLANEFFSGQLLSVNNGTFTINFVDSYSSTQLTILIQSVEYLRVLLIFP
ncbi:hypothetical protein SAMN04487897_1108 [Paenibacillus sp. yr247]|uniref:hypothetical protein n=1 Tax=Paenibacillus sp. yr247 TaxID=1761880 RepID=UPI00088F260D|nr:hypothetical protein [Paenibacillus sp. yr247]SDO21751.1 hypothetical protein SAMN04487897_1108 [Paenibacillus sp. yr247]